jgi:hypothetical protein
LEPYIARCHMCAEKDRLAKTVSADRAAGASIGVRPFDPDITWIDEELRELPGAEGSG